MQVGGFKINSVDPLFTAAIMADMTRANGIGGTVDRGYVPGAGGTSGGGGGGGCPRTTQILMQGHGGLNFLGIIMDGQAVANTLINRIQEVSPQAMVNLGNAHFQRETSLAGSITPNSMKMSGLIDAMKAFYTN